jgi:hypothetical protein
MGNEDRCDRCGDPVWAGSARYHDRVVLADGRLVCHECSRALRGHVEPVMKRGDVPITMPNSNLPNTH